MSVKPAFKWFSESLSDDYTLIVSTSADESNTVVNIVVSDTSHTLGSALDNGRQYYWNVRGNNANGSGPLTTWRLFVTVPGGAAQVSLTSPADGATGVDINPVLTWGAVAGAATYRLQVSTSADFVTTVVDDASISTTQFQPTLVYDQKYYWRVRASNAAEFNWSSVWSLTTEAPPEAGRVTLVSPSNGSSGVSATPTLKWNEDEESDSYNLEVATTQDFAAPVVSETGLSDTTFASTALENGTTHFWRVRGVNTAGLGAWSTLFSFTTIPGGAQQVVLLSPSNGAQDVGFTPLLRWGKIQNAVSYTLQVSKQSNFSSTVINRDAVTSTQFQTSTLEAQTKYYWRVRASNTGSSNWSLTWSFTTSRGIPDKVSLLSPADKSQNVTVNTILKWSQALNADSYQIQMSMKEDDFTETSYEASGITGTEHQVPELIYGSVYWWRVRAVNESGSGLWSGQWGYLTERGGPDQPLIVSPLPGETGVSLEPLLVWSSVQESAGKLGSAVTYHVQIATSFSFSGGSIVAEETQNPDTTFQVTGLLPDTTYAWRVKASTAGPINWTITSSFVTGKGVPGQVVLESPEDGAVEAPLETDLRWTVPVRATSFNLQVSLDSAFTSVVISETGLSDITHRLVGLDPTTDYFWRAQAINLDGVGEWSEKWHFATVGLAAPLGPILISPLNGATEVSHKPLFTWNASETATSYKLEISTNPTFSTVAIAVLVTQSFYQAEGLVVGQLYFWRVEARNAGGSSVSDVWGFTTVLTTDTESDEIPGSFALEQNYPNPFNPTTTLEFSMPKGGEAHLVVYNVRGEVVARLVDGNMPAGRHRILWNAVNLPSGVYLYRFQAGDFVSTKKLTLAK